MAGAPVANSNAAKSKRLWSDTIRRAALHADGKQLREIVDKMFEMAAAGDIQAMKEIGDRLEGKAVQQTILSGDEDNPLAVLQRIERVIIKK